MTPAEIAVALLATPRLPADLAAAVASAVGGVRAEVSVAGVAVAVGAGGDGEPVGYDGDGVTIRAWQPSADVAFVGDVAAAAVPLSLELARRAEANDVLRHDTRTWLGIGQGYVSMLAGHFDAMTPEQRAGALAGVGGAFGRLDAFARRVLLDEKLATRSAVVRPVEVTAEALLGPLRAAYPSVAFEADDVRGPLWLDPAMVRDVVDDLVANAGAPVTVRLSGALRVEVRGAAPTPVVPALRRLVDLLGGSLAEEGGATVVELAATPTTS